MDWIDKTISPLPAEAREGLRLPLALAIGPDPVTMLKDVVGLDAERTRRVLKRAERAMLRAAVQLNGRSKDPCAVISQPFLSPLRKSGCPTGKVCSTQDDCCRQGHRGLSYAGRCFNGQFVVPGQLGAKVGWLAFDNFCWIQ